MVHLRYEDLVQDPEKHMREVCAFLDLPFEPGMVDYGKQPSSSPAAGRGLGDPVTVARETRPTTASVGKWLDALAQDPARLGQCREIAAQLADEDLETWGYPGPELRQALAEIQPSGTGPSRAKLSRHALERRLLVTLRRGIHTNALGRLVRRVRTACDVLLR
jgi:hypothetical protein